MSTPITCPHCGKSTAAVGDQAATCSHCGKTIDVPEQSARPAGPSERSGMHPVAIVLMVLVGGFLLAGLLMPPVRCARVASRRAACINHLTQLGLTMHAYHDKHGCFPPAYLADENGKPMHSWRILLLPHMEYGWLYDEYDFDEPWDSPKNRELTEYIPREYQCPKALDNMPTETNYMMIVGPETVSDGPGSSCIGSMTNDGTSWTIMLVEVTGTGVHWAEPRDLNAEEIDFSINRDSGAGIGSPHPAVINVLFCDGTVRSLAKSTDPEKMKALSTIDGGEDVSFLDD